MIIFEDFVQIRRRSIKSEIECVSMSFNEDRTMQSPKDRISRLWCFPS